MIHRSSFLLLGAVAVLSSCGGGADTGLPNGKVTRAQVLRGRYIVTTSGCAGCHSHDLDDPSDAKWLAGYQAGTPGQPYTIGAPPGFKTYPSNLTPDQETGLGKWTGQNIFDALRTGKDPDGQYLAPPMPWKEIRQMTDEDLWAIVAYLQSIKPVSNAVPESQGPNPFPNGHGDWSGPYTGTPAVGIPMYPTANEIEVK